MFTKGFYAPKPSSYALQDRRRMSWLEPGNLFALGTVNEILELE